MAAIRRNPTLSDDVISEILVRVPVKSLLRFQSVCKTWLSLIKHPVFVKSQLLRATTTETDQTIIIEDNNFLLFCVDSRKIVADLKFPYPRGEFEVWPYFKLVGSANGIVCVAGFPLAYFPHKRKISLYLWNPAIRQSKVIPSCTLTNEYIIGALGFGYDPIDHDFKVIRVVRNRHHCAEVYSANKNVWRKLPGSTDIPWNNDFDVCVNGYLCGMGMYGMMMFDLNKEVLNCEIKFPVISDNDHARCIEFNNSVAVVILSKGLTDVKTDRRLDEKISIWTLNDVACLRGGGGEALWTPMFSIGLVTPKEILFGYFNNRDLLLLVLSDGYKWISCNADKKEAKIVPLSVDMAGHDYTRQIYKYTESLISLAGFKQVNWNAGEDDN